MNNNVENKIVYLRLDDILPNRFQPREIFDETGLEELANSIKEHGVIQPIIVRQIGDKYELIAGERRSKASALAGLTTVPAIIKNMNDKESTKVSLLENLQRKNLSAIEEARTYKKIIELENLTQDDLAKTMGKSQPMIANKLRLLSLPGEIQDALIKNQISERHARSLLNVKDKNTQLILLDRIRNERLTVRELDVEIKKLSNTNVEYETNNYNKIENNNYFDPNNSDINQSNPFNSQNSMNYFANTNSNVYESNQPNSFNNMGLDDYKTSVSSNMLPNMENNLNQNFSNMYLGNENNNTKSNIFMKNIEKDDNSDYDYKEITSEKNEGNDNYYSLGSMFDGNQGSQVSKEILEQEKDVNKDFFISNLKESNIRTQENKFLPNFSNEQFNNNDFSNEYSDSNDNSFQLNDQPFERSNEFVDFNQNMNSSDSFVNFSQMQSISNNNDEFSFQKPINQGELFNQPLNIINVPEEQIDQNSQLETSEIDNSLENHQDESFDNPFDDQYESILFAEPVSIKPETNIINNESNQNSVEVINNDIENEESKIDFETSNNNQSTEVNQDKYISLEHTRTIFDTKEAVLELKRTTDRIKEEGFDMESEEIDYDDYYQIVIKIKK